MTLLSDAEIEGALAGLGWEREGDCLLKAVKGKDFATALAWVNAVGGLAEEANHHPDIDIRWNVVTLRLSTHSEGGITDKDVEMAREINEVLGAH